MNFVRKTPIKYFQNVLNKNYLCTEKLTKKLSVEQLSNRTLLQVKGDEATTFLQGLITNDINHLERGSNSIYTLFLNTGGRVLFDSLLYKTLDANKFLIECDTSVEKDLQKHLKLFRVRRKIDVDLVGDEYNVWVAYSESRTVISTLCHTEEVSIFTDPRLNSLGSRIIAKKNVEFLDFSQHFPNQKLELAGKYEELRYKLGIGEGVLNIVPGKSLPLESNCDYLNGISFHKGCYIGQELTARTHHTGVIRKRLMPLKFNAAIAKETENKELEIITNAEKSVGKLRGICGDCGLGLIRIDQALEAKYLKIHEISCTTKKPSWWPLEAKSTN